MAGFSLVSFSTGPAPAVGDPTSVGLSRSSRSRSMMYGLFIKFSAISACAVLPCVGFLRYDELASCMRPATKCSTPGYMASALQLV